MTRGAPADKNKKNYYYIKSTNGNLTRVLGDRPELFVQALEYKYTNNLELSHSDLQAIHDYSSKWIYRDIGRKTPINFNKMAEYLCDGVTKMHFTQMRNNTALNPWFMQMAFIVINGIDKIPSNFFNYYLNNMFGHDNSGLVPIVLSKLSGDQFRKMKMYVVENHYHVDDFIQLIKDYMPYMDSYCREYFYSDLPEDYQLGILL